MSIPVKTEEWEHGLRCMDCDRELTEANGDTYSERLGGFVDDTPVTEIICSECALGRHVVNPLPPVAR